MILTMFLIHCWSRTLHIYFFLELFVGIFIPVFFPVNPAVVGQMGLNVGIVRTAQDAAPAEVRQ
jgi:hypothetical protein